MLRANLGFLFRYAYQISWEKGITGYPGIENSGPGAPLVPIPGVPGYPGTWQKVNFYSVCTYDEKSSNWKAPQVGIAGRFQLVVSARGTRVPRAP
eukprot:2519403-Rhodomonas_salina.1